MVHYIEIPHGCPVQFYPLDIPQDSRYNHIHLEADWFYKQVKWYEKKVWYAQKWQQNDGITIALKSTLSPVEIDILDCNGRKVVENIPIPLKPISAAGLEYNWYEKVIDISTIVPGNTALPEGEYYLLLSAGTISNAIYAISEPIQVKAKWPKTLLLQYTNNRNDYDMFWETGIELSLRFEGILSEHITKTQSTTFESQTKNISRLQAIPYNPFDLKIGGEGGIPPWLQKKIAYAFCCSYKSIDGLQVEVDDGADFEPQYTEGYPAPYYSIAMREANNRYSKRITAPGDVNSSQLIVFDLSTWTWFGSIGGDANSAPVRIQKEV